MSNICDFLRAALPWLAMGLFLAVFFVRSSHEKKNDKECDNYGTEGMCIGMCIGLSLGMALAKDTGTGLSLGMMIGLAVGSFIKKEAGE